jgi:hypothetical protein
MIISTRARAAPRTSGLLPVRHRPVEVHNEASQPTLQRVCGGRNASAAKHVRYGLPGSSALSSPRKKRYAFRAGDDELVLRTMLENGDIFAMRRKGRTAAWETITDSKWTRNHGHHALTTLSATTPYTGLPRGCVGREAPQR